MDSILNIEQANAMRQAQLRADSAEYKDFSKKLAAYEADKEQYALNQGRDMVEHFTAFVDGLEKSFQRYFVVGNDHHRSMHDGFWEALEEAYPDIELDSEHEDAGVALYTFGDSRVGLIARNDYGADIESGSEVGVFGINYEAVLLPDIDNKTLGTIAITQAMQ